MTARREVDGLWKGLYPKVFGHYHNLSLNKFFDPGGMTEIVTINIVASQLSEQRQTATPTTRAKISSLMC